MRNKVKNPFTQVSNLDLDKCSNVIFLAHPLRRYFVVAHDFNHATFCGKLCCKTEGIVHDFIFYMTGRKEGRIWWQDEFEVVKSVTPGRMMECEKKIENLAYILFRRDLARRNGWSYEEMHKYTLDRKMKNRDKTLGIHRNLNFLLHLNRAYLNGYVECLENRQDYVFSVVPKGGDHLVKWSSNWFFQNDVFVKGLRQTFEKYILTRIFYNSQRKLSDKEIKKNTLSTFGEREFFLNKNFELDKGRGEI